MKKPVLLLSSLLLTTTVASSAKVVTDHARGTLVAFVNVNVIPMDRRAFVRKSHRDAEGEK